MMSAAPTPNVIYRPTRELRSRTGRRPRIGRSIEVIESRCGCSSAAPRHRAQATYRQGARLPHAGTAPARVARQSAFTWALTCWAPLAITRAWSLTWPNVCAARSTLMAAVLALLPLRLRRGSRPRTRSATPTTSSAMQFAALTMA